jgi:polysaccharide biosynthesis transport protein
MELKTYFAPLRKWWWLILASTIIATVTSYLAVSQQPPIYRTHATLLIGSAINNPNPSGNEFWLSQQLAETYTNLAQRDVVRQAVMDSLGITWLPAYLARVVPNTQLIEIIVTDTNPERAMVVANELANQLIRQSPTNIRDEEETARQSFIKNQLDDLEINIQETSDSILVKQEELSGLFSARQIADTQNQIAALNSKLITLQNNYASLIASTTAGAANSLSIIEPATIPQYPVGPEVVMTLLTAAVIGMALAVGAAYFLEYLDDTVKTPEDVQKSTNLPTLAGIAEYKTDTNQYRNLITLQQPRSPISEAYRSLRTAVTFSNIDEDIKTILVTSASPADGKSLTAANLSVVLAQAGNRVLLVDLDLRRPMQHRIFEVSRNIGLTNLLVEMTGTADPAELSGFMAKVNIAAVETLQPGLMVMPGGQAPPNPAEVIGSAKMKRLLEFLATQFDYIIVDSPPVLVVTDAVILSTRVDGVILVASSGNTRRNQLAQAVLRLHEVKNSKLVGVVLNRLTARSGDYYHYYYKSNYYDEESSRDSGDRDRQKSETKDRMRQSKTKNRSARPGIMQNILTKFLG